MRTSLKWTALAAVLTTTMAAFACGDDLPRQRLSHDHAIDAVTEVVAEVLDLQLRKLEVNGLQGQAIYRELLSSSGVLRGLIEREMAELQSLLGDTDSLDGIAVDVRRLARRIVVKLTAERLRVERRRGDVSEIDKQELDSDSLAQQVAELKDLGETLDQLLEKQARAKQMAADDVGAARELEESIGTELEKADNDSELNDEVESRLDEAQDAVADAEKQLQDDAEAAPTDRMQAIEAAADALMQARVEVESQLNDMNRTNESSVTYENATDSEGLSKNQASSGTTRDLDAGATARGDHAIKSRSLVGQAWFTRLPPELQSVIRARTRRRAPRGYEERLREYFRSTD